MIRKRELMIRICCLEDDVEFLYNEIDELNKKLKKVDKPAKKEKKSVKVSK